LRALSVCQLTYLGMEILQTPSFKRKVNKLHREQRKVLEKAIRRIVNQPSMGQAKKGDLAGVRVDKFKILIIN
jgi:mRNA-degrading endonuclease RelE of RelBE toxin-antitoxin system